MTAGGDDPTEFVHDAPYDWFHNNAADLSQIRRLPDCLQPGEFCYRIDYETGAIKWILGDPTKHWHDFQSLRNYCFDATGPDTLPRSASMLFP